MLLEKSLNDAGGKQRGIDIVAQCRPVMAMAIDGADRVADLKS